MRSPLRLARISCFALTALVAVDRPAKAQRQIYVTDGNSVKVYDAAADGNVAPVRVLTGVATNLQGGTHGIALDPVHNEMFVLSGSTISLNVFPLSAHGNTAPTRSLAGPATTLTIPEGIALDLVNDEILVTNNGRILVFARTASGNTAPLRSIAGPMTQLDFPYGVSVDTGNNEIAVGDAPVAKVQVFSRTASGNVMPLRTISGLATNLNGPIQAILDPAHNELLVTNAGPPTGPHRITVYPRSGAGNISPMRTIEGAATKLASPFGMFLDGINDELVVVNAGGAAGPSVSFFSRTASGDIAPLRRIAGTATQLSAPRYAEIGPAFGNNYYTLTPCRVIDTRNPGGPYGGPALTTGLIRNFTLTGQCGLPSNVTAAAVNIAVTQPTSGPGFLTLYPAGTPRPLFSSINYSASQTRANNAVIPLDASGAISVFCGQGAGTVHFILDISGYFQ